MNITISFDAAKGQDILALLTPVQYGIWLGIYFKSVEIAYDCAGRARW